jgi:hypothetical protein
MVHNASWTPSTQHDIHPNPSLTRNVGSLLFGHGLQHLTHTAWRVDEAKCLTWAILLGTSGNIIHDALQRHQDGAAVVITRVLAKSFQGDVPHMELDDLRAATAARSPPPSRGQQDHRRHNHNPNPIHDVDSCATKERNAAFPGHSWRNLYHSMVDSTE